jgi:inositol 1,4,5-triphosphate receptor type 1/inositol 1,4,5-triphosphate receptor type 3
VLLWKDLAFLLTITLNFLIVVSYFDGETGDAATNYHMRIYEPRFMGDVLNTTQTLFLFRVCGILMIICSTFVVAFFLLKKGPLYARDAWNQSEGMLETSKNWLVRVGLYMFLVGTCIVKVIMNIEVMYYLAYGTLAFVATLVHPFFFAFHLTELVLRYPTMRNIIRSFWEPKTALFLSLVLVFLFNYYFAIFSYVIFPELYNNRKC